MSLTPNQPNPDNLPAVDFPPAPTFTLRRIFFGPQCLRAGWGLVVFFAIFLTLLAGSQTAEQKFTHRHNPPVPSPAAAGASAPKPTHHLTTPSHFFVGEGSALVSALLATLALARIERRPFRAYGLNPTRQLPNFFAGLAWGIILLSLLIVTLRAQGLLVFDARLLYGRAIAGYGLLWLLGFLVVGLFEETFFRGYMQFTLARSLTALYRRTRAPNPIALAFWTAALLFSFGFGFIHKSNPGESPVGLLSAALIGVVLCLSLWRTGSLLWAIGFHAAWDWGESFLYGVADSGTNIQGALFSTHPAGRVLLSGGLTGPEGSLYILLTIALTAAVILLTVRRTSPSASAELESKLTPPSPP